MIIQKLQFPKENICSNWNMFFRKDSGFSNEEAGRIVLKSGEKLSLDTYYNSFALAKWCKYTNIHNLSLYLRYDGDVKITAFGAKGNLTDKDRFYEFYHLTDYYAKAERKEIDINTYVRSDGIEVSFLRDMHWDVVYVVIQATQDTIFYGGEYTTDIDNPNYVRIALGICTFRRETFVIQNVNTIIEKLIENEQSNLYHHLEIYIADNGQTLPQGTFCNSFVHLFPNANVGGTGGFTRGMIEAILRPKDCPYTHFIIMDDDIIINPEVIERNYAFLQLIREEYVDLIISGALFDINERNIQYLSGEQYEYGRTITHNKIWDMCDFDAVVANEIEKQNNYGGWWYCCTPVCHITKDNLPIPLFIHQDDIEFGLRNSNNSLLLLNGINVWHIQGMGKGSASIAYYDMRNWLIATSAYDNARASVHQVLEKLTEEFLGGVIRYHYLNFDYVCMGLEAFLAGPDSFMKLDAVDNHMKLLNMCYKYQKPEEVGIELTTLRDKGFEKLPRYHYIIDALCWLLPARKDPVVCTLHDCGLPYMHGSLYIYDESRGAGIYSERNYKEAFRCLKKYFKFRRRVKKELKDMQQVWTKRKNEYTNLDFWNKYLGLKE